MKGVTLLQQCEQPYTMTGAVRELRNSEHTRVRLPPTIPDSVILSDAAVRLWQSSLRLGSCSHHNALDRSLLQADCKHASIGSTRVRNNMTWKEASYDCLTYCFGCRNCNFVSLSIERGYCAWHQECATLDNILHQHGAHRAFSAKVLRGDHGWLSSASSYEDSFTAAARFQAWLDRALLKKPSQMVMESPASGACLKRRWLLAVGDSVLRVVFARIVEELTLLPDDVPR